MSYKIQQLRNKLEQQKGKKETLNTLLDKCSNELRKEKQQLRKYEKAKSILQEVGLKTQQQLQYHISEITTLALNAIFDDPYKLGVEFVQRRNKTECDLYFEKNGMRADPLSASGGGVVDVASFALRLTSFAMQPKQSRSVIILDEPLRFLSVDNQEKASELIKELSIKLGIQFIIITHEQTLTAAADKVFTITNRKGISKINGN